MYWPGASSSRPLGTDGATSAILTPVENVLPPSVDLKITSLNVGPDAGAVRIVDRDLLGGDIERAAGRIDDRLCADVLLEGAVLAQREREEGFRPLISPPSSEPPDSAAENPARPGRFERPTSRSGGERSIH